MTRKDFTNLTRSISNAIIACAAFKPYENEPKDLRKVYHEVYEFCAKWAALAFEKDFIPDFLFDLSIDGVDLINGVVLLSFTHDDRGRKTRHQLAAYNELAPYSKTWPDKLQEHGVNPSKAIAQFNLV